jgi:hypothetical protein
MASEDHRFRTLSSPAVLRETDECLSSWLLRIALALGLSKAELEQELGTPLGILGFARGSEAVKRAAARTGVPASSLIAAIHPDNLARSPEALCEVPRAFAVCSDCLENDRAGGKQPYVRIAWTHPLSAWCLEHQKPLNALDNLELWEGSWSLMIEGPLRSDRLLEVATPLEAIGLERTAAFIADGAAVPVKQFTNEISDIVDALSVQANLVTGPGSVMGVFERRRRGRSNQSWGTQLPQGIMYAHSGADRLLLVRTALSIRTNACDGLGEWMSNYIQLAVPRGRRRALVNLEPDPLLLLALALPIHNFHQLSLRTSLWSRDFQDRWHNCAIAAAFSGFN